MADYPNDEFDVDLDARTVKHRPSGVVVSFYEYTSEAEWHLTASVTVRDNPGFTGDLLDLARCAKRAAVAAGMTAQRPATSRKVWEPLRGMAPDSRPGPAMPQGV